MSIFIYFIMNTILISMILIFPFSPLYKNIQRNYGDLIQRIVNNISHNKVDKNTQIEDKENSDSVSKDEIVTAVLSKRTIYADIIKQKFNNSSWIDKLFGIGYNVEIRDEIYTKKTIDSKQLELLQKLGFIVEINDEVYTQKTIELDQLDILYRHGILGFVVYFAQFIAIILLIAKQIILKMEYFLNLDVVICIIDIVLALGIAFTAGHILTAPAVGFFLITSTIKLYNDIFKKVV
nr:O-antigen ligase family protein [Romboutsia ilealis]